MENTQKKINIDEDRLSNLPEDAVECIMEFLPLRDAARTCVLSPKWRHIWANHPSLVFDKAFWVDMQRHNSTQEIKDTIATGHIVSSVLLSHFGHIRKFVIDISTADPSHKTIDLWLSYLSRKGKNLKVLHFSDHFEADPYYEVPCFVFFTISDLSLSFCCIRKALGCFNNIQSLFLHGVRIDSSLVRLTAPLLTSLSMKKCSDYDRNDFVFNISAPKLAFLTLDRNHLFKLQPFFECKDIDHAFLASAHDDFLTCDGKHLPDFLAFWPKVSVLELDGLCFKELATGNIPDNVHLPPLNLRRLALRGVDLDCEKIAWILYLLKNSPLLHTFEFRFGKNVWYDIEEPSIAAFEMGQLRTIKIKGFTASRNEVNFIEILLKCAPFLEKMLVDEVSVDPWKLIKLLKR